MITGNVGWWVFGIGAAPGEEPEPATSLTRVAVLREPTPAASLLGQPSTPRPRSTRPRLLAGLAALVVLVGGLAGCGTSATGPGSKSAALVYSLPKDTRWQDFHGVAIPSSVTAGPTATTSTGVLAGYAQSPAGAVIAAFRGQAELALTPDKDWPATVAVITAPGPGRDGFVGNRALLSVTGDVPATAAPRFVGYKIASYHAGNPTTAAVWVAERIKDKTFAWPVALQWLAGDWRIVLPTPAENVDAVELTNLAGYTTVAGAPS